MGATEYIRRTQIVPHLGAMQMFQHVRWPGRGDRYSVLDVVSPNTIDLPVRDLRMPADRSAGPRNYCIAGPVREGAVLIMYVDRPIYPFDEDALWTKAECRGN